ncbi:MAG: type II and III secretion system protein [Planctomycetes bacterium]|nr:type II and III secretion system protein [Planctomycetota bacterium]
MVPRRRRSPVLFAALGLLLALGCRSDQAQQQKKDRDRLTMEMFQELIREGTLRPVDSMEDAFGGIQPDMGDTPEDYEKAAAARVEEARNEPRGADGVTEPQPPFVEAPFNPYARFGKRIRVHDATGLITKPYPMRSGVSQKVLDFMMKYGDFPLWDGQGQQPQDTVYFEIAPGFDTEFLAANLRGAGPQPGKDIPMGDWLVVTANREWLEEVEFFIDTFAAGPPQIEIEAKIVEWVTREGLDLGVGDAMMQFGPDTLVDSLEWSFPNNAGDLSGGEFLAGLGTIHDGVTYSALFEALSSFENVSIISRPKVAVREGIKAQIEAVEKLPYLKITSINNTGNIATAIDYQDVGVRLYVTPRLVGTGTIALQIDIEASQQTGSAVTFQSAGGSAGFVDTPILATRSAETVVYLKPGQAVILGGLIAERTVEEERGIPILMDLPLLGYLFKSTYDATELATLLFFIRPRVLEGTDVLQDF